MLLDAIDDDSGWFILTTTKDDRPTRLAVGCPEQGAELEDRLLRAGYDVHAEFGRVPERDAAEKNRATRLVAEMFGN